MDRRTFLVSGTAAAVCGTTAIKPFHAFGQSFANDPFSLGVASNVQRPNAVTLWTRLAPAPLEPSGGLDPVSLPVRWELAADENFSRPVASGAAIAHPDFAHSVRVTVDGLEPGRHYWYRFLSGDAVSRLGRTKTLPDATTPLDSLRFATASCQHYEQGYFVAYDHMIADDPDFVLHLGDFIYGVSRGDFRNHTRKDRPVSLEDYRIRHALYNTDESLQRARAAFPFYCVLDNHDALPDLVGTPEALAQRAAAYQAWFEHMPMEGGHTLHGRSLLTHGSIDFGDLLRLNILDTRQFRDDQDLCRNLADPDFAFTIYRPLCDPVAETQRTMLGHPQESWLASRLQTSDATWNAIGSTVLFAPFPMEHAGDLYHYESSWDYYPENRQRVLTELSRASNPMVLSADVHSNWAIDIKADPNDPESQTIGAEMLATSISSGWPPPLDFPMRENLGRNPHVRHYDGSERGYMLHDLTTGTWTTAMRVVDDARDLTTGVHDQARFVVEAGNPGVQSA